MATKRTKDHGNNRRGVGTCGNPSCSEPRAEGSYLCEAHRKEMAVIRDESERDPRLTWNQRSDNANRLTHDGRAPVRRAPKSPVCCYVGCFEHRVPPDAYCDGHATEVIYD